tara:strand:+ start:188 stop:457 length:270 start_codon:yes stop_codon:yes gene_type:complete
MAKATKEVKEEVSYNGKTEDELVEIIQNVQIQMNNESTIINKTQSKLQTHTTRRLKLQGLLEGLLQMVPKERIEQLIQPEEKETEISEG